MSKVAISNTPNTALWYHPDTRIVHHELKGFACGQELRDHFMRGLETIKAKQAAKWLSDDRGFTAMTPEDQEWAMTTWTPAAVKAGFRYWAIVMPEKALAQFALKKYVEAFRSLGVTAQFFSAPDAAKDWLVKQAA